MSHNITDINAFKAQLQAKRTEALATLRNHANAVLSLIEGRADLDDAAYQLFLANDKQVAEQPDIHQDLLDGLELLEEQFSDALDFLIGSYVEYCLDNDREVLTMGFDDE